jgi:hypothetical protein
MSPHGEGRPALLVPLACMVKDHLELGLADEV